MIESTQNEVELKPFLACNIKVTPDIIRASFVYIYLVAMICSPSRVKKKTILDPLWPGRASPYIEPRYLPYGTIYNY